MPQPPTSTVRALRGHLAVAFKSKRFSKQQVVVSNPALPSAHEGVFATRVFHPFGDPFELSVLFNGRTIASKTQRLPDEWLKENSQVVHGLSHVKRWADKIPFGIGKALEEGWPNTHWPHDVTYAFALDGSRHLIYDLAIGPAWNVDRRVWLSGSVDL